MNEKITKVIDKIASNIDQVQEIRSSGSEYYFKFKGHAMSIMQRQNHEEDGESPYRFFLYPKWSGSLDKLVHTLDFSQPEDDFPIASYDARDAPEIKLRTLYKLLQKEHEGVDRMLDDILAEDVPF